MRETRDLVKDIAEAQKQAEEIKLKQKTGAASLVIREITTDQTWDVDGTYSTSTTQFFKFWFLADHQTGPVASFRPYVLIDGVEWNLTDRTFFMEFLTTPQFTGLTDDELERTALESYLLFASSPTSYNVKIKMRVLANDTGTIGVYVDT